MAEISIPVKIKGKDFTKGILKIKAAAEPDQEPVKGKGSATNKIKARDPYFAYFPLNLFLVLEKNQSKNFFPHFDFRDTKR